MNIVNEKNMLKRLKLRRKLNRYDKFHKKFYKSVQKGFLKIASKNKKKYQIIDSNLNIKDNETKIINTLSKFI